jgi:flavin-dependent dehydrogenase
VFILGAGPAGCSVAINLARWCRVAVVDRHLTPILRPGESLPPAANKLLRDMKIFDELKQQGHLPYYGNQFRWGSDELAETDFLRIPLGHGWHLDRQKFEEYLRKTAEERGATMIAPARFERIEWNTDRRRWTITIAQGQERRTIEARIVVDAGGRTPIIAKRLGAKRIHLDNMVCAWVIGQDQTQYGVHGLSYIHAVPEGWWYTAPLPDGKRILTFHTTADNPATEWMHSAHSLIENAHKVSPFREQRIFADIHQADVPEKAEDFLYGYTAANSALTEPSVGTMWLTVGDAALSVDPVSSQGLFNALYTGLVAAESIDRCLRGEIQDFVEYQEHIHSLATTYRKNLWYCYSTEQRWKDEAFWKNR